MALAAKFTRDAVKRHIKKSLNLFEQAIINALSRLGEKCITHSRTLDTYKDQTGNLRSSIGYLVVVNGKIVTTAGFDVIKKGEKGQRTGLTLAVDLAKAHSTGYVLIVVAGMNYAEHVEKIGYDVISSAENLAKNELPKMLKSLSKNLG